MRNHYLQPYLRIMPLAQTFTFSMGKVLMVLLVVNTLHIHHGYGYRFGVEKNDFGGAQTSMSRSLDERDYNVEDLVATLHRKSRYHILNPDPEVHMNVTEIIKYHGYPVEAYTVPTDDGFLLGVQRIPHGRNENVQEKLNTGRPVVFLQHGLLCSSTNWVTNLPNESLAFILADAGFDVWLGNMRGNTYSRRHKTLKPDQAAFWAWSWDEHAAKDLPAMINYTLKMSGAESLYYVGHSQGTLIAFAQLSQDQELSKRIKSFMAMGPVITAGHAKGPVRILAYLSPDLQTILNIFGVHEFLPNNIVLDLLARTFCTYETRFLCADVLFLLSGFDLQNLNQTRLPVYISHTPAGTSVQNMVHFSQMVRRGRFQMYDYGSADLNKKKYGQATPPLYNATNVKVPVVLFSADNDWLADPEDVETLANTLPNLVHHYRIPKWNHLDFIWGVDAANVVYDKIIKYIKSDLKKSNVAR